MDTAVPSHSSPPARNQQTMAYDPELGVVVLFGGTESNGEGFQDTWTWDGTTWTQIFPPAMPAGRASFGMDFGFRAGIILIFGGYGAPLAYSDTWQLR